MDLLKRGHRSNGAPATLSAQQTAMSPDAQSKDHPPCKPLPQRAFRAGLRLACALACPFNAVANDHCQRSVQGTGHSRRGAMVVTKQPAQPRATTDFQRVRNRLRSTSTQRPMLELRNLQARSHIWNCDFPTESGRKLRTGSHKHRGVPAIAAIAGVFALLFRRSPIHSLVCGHVVRRILRRLLCWLVSVGRQLTSRTAAVAGQGLNCPAVLRIRVNHGGGPGP